MSKALSPRRRPWHGTRSGALALGALSLALLGLGILFASPATAVGPCERAVRSADTWAGTVHARAESRPASAMMVLARADLSRLLMSAINGRLETLGLANPVERVLALQLEVAALELREAPDGMRVSFDVVVRASAGAEGRFAPAGSMALRLPVSMLARWERAPREVQLIVTEVQLAADRIGLETSGAARLVQGRFEEQMRRVGERLVARLPTALADSVIVRVPAVRVHAGRLRVMPTYARFTGTHLVLEVAVLRDDELPPPVASAPALPMVGVDESVVLMTMSELSGLVDRWLLPEGQTSVTEPTGHARAVVAQVGELRHQAGGLFADVSIASLRRPCAELRAEASLALTVFDNALRVDVTSLELQEASRPRWIVRRRLPEPSELSEAWTRALAEFVASLSVSSVSDAVLQIRPESVEVGADGVRLAFGTVLEARDAPSERHQRPE